MPTYILPDGRFSSTNYCQNLLRACLAQHWRYRTRYGRCAGAPSTMPSTLHAFHGRWPIIEVSGHHTSHSTLLISVMTWTLSITAASSELLRSHRFVALKFCYRVIVYSNLMSNNCYLYFCRPQHYSFAYLWACALAAQDVAQAARFRKIRAPHFTSSYARLGDSGTSN
jgi:hypothetical protein